MTEVREQMTEDRKQRKDERRPMTEFKKSISLNENDFTKTEIEFSLSLNGLVVILYKFFNNVVVNLLPGVLSEIVKRQPR